MPPTQRPNVLLIGTPGPRREDLALALAAATEQRPRLLEDLKGLGSYDSDAMPPLVVLLDPEGRDTSTIAEIRQLLPEAPLLVAALKGDVERVSAAARAGARDYLVCGDELHARVATAIAKLSGWFDVVRQNRQLAARNTDLEAEVAARGRIIGESEAMRGVLQQIRRVADVPRPVLITGERGTGKELVARAIHQNGPRADSPLITVNCAAFSDALLESELFGHERGAFTGADARRIGRFEQAQGSTLFLDEVGNMSLPFQQKILRVVEYGTFTRVGGTDELHTDARILAATNVDLAEHIREGRFLSDLYDRLAFAVIRVPPLRERGEDVALLAQRFLDQFVEEMPGIDRKHLTPDALADLGEHAFPGNVRELKNLIERAAIRDEGEAVRAAHLGLAGSPQLQPTNGGSFAEQIQRFKRRLLEEALEQTKGNQAAAARLLGMPYHRFRYHLKATDAS